MEVTPKSIRLRKVTLKKWGWAAPNLEEKEKG